MVDITNVVNVSLAATPDLAQVNNVNAVAMFTSDSSFVNSLNRYAIYKSIGAVAEDFGTHSSFYQYALTFFATQPNSVNGDGYLIAGFWRSEVEIIPARAASLRSVVLVENDIVSQLQQINDGSFTIDIDNTITEVTGLDFQTSTSLTDIANVIQANAALAALADVAIIDNMLTITSLTIGATSSITLVTEASSGTFVGEILKIAVGSGATLVQGAAEDDLAAETRVDALTAIKSEIYFAGSMFIDSVSDIEVPEIAAWCEANKVLSYDVFSGDSYLAVSVANPVWNVKLTGQTHYRCLYSKSNNRKLATSYMARNHSVIFTAQNSAITMNLKELAVEPEIYSETEVFQAKEVGLALYSSIKNTSIVLDSGANNYVDNVYNTMSLVNDIQINAYNLLRGTNTKIAQTTAGVSKLVTNIEQSIQTYVRAGVVAAGTWTGTDTFGDLNAFKRAIEQQGYYVLAGLLSEQSEADRIARKSPVIQAAIKFAGAIEHVDIIINIEY